MEEVWKPVVGFEKYSVSNLGRIKNPFGKILRPSPNYKGYLHVNLNSEDIKHKHYSVHRAVALAFIPNPDNLSQINHKNHNVQDNRVENLEWCSNEYNQRYSHSKSISQYNIRGVLLREWESISDAQRALDIPSTNISKCCKGTILTLNGYIFLYSGESISERLNMMQLRKHKSKTENKL